MRDLRRAVRASAAGLFEAFVFEEPPDGDGSMALSRALRASAALLKTARGGDLKSTNLGASRPSFGALLAPAASTSMALCCSAATSSASSNASARLAVLRRRSADVGVPVLWMDEGVPVLLIRAERPGLRPGLFFGVRAGLFRGLLGAALLDERVGIFWWQNLRARLSSPRGSRNVISAGGRTV